MALQDILSPIIFGGGYVQSLSSSFGFNSNPTTVDITIVATGLGMPGSLGFIESDVLPGKVSGIRVSGFKFMGLIQSWNENYGPDGITHNIRLADPRLNFSDIFVIMNGKSTLLPNNTNINNGSGIWNVINAYMYYGNDSDAGFNENGMEWNKVKAVLEYSDGYINLYNQRFKLQFGSGFEAPPYYKVGSYESTLDSLLDSVANALGIDYYANINYDTYATGMVNTILINTISRAASGQTGTGIINFINQKRATSGLIRYSRGQELRQGPTDGLVFGANRSFMQTISQHAQCWGRNSDGALLTSAENSSDNFSSLLSTTNPDRYNGWVIFDGITGYNPAIISALPTLTYRGRSRYLQAGSFYPPLALEEIIDDSVIGYRPTENVMRAALFSQESWEHFLWVEQPGVAYGIGITGAFIKGPDETLLMVRNDSVSSNLYKVGPDEFNRTEEQAAIIQLFYEKTKDVADKYYGKQFVVALPRGKIYPNVSGVATGTTLNFRYGYRVVDAAYYENASTALKRAGNNTFRTNDGRHKAHVRLSNAATLINNAGIPNVWKINNTYGVDDKMTYDWEKWDKSQYFIEGNDVLIACNVEQDNTNLSRAIVTLPQPVELKIEGTGYTQFRQSYVEFFRALGYSDAQIFGTGSFPYAYNSDGEFYLPNGLILFEEFSPEIGLAPKRQNYFDYFYVPLENELKQYGPFIKLSDRPGGTTVIKDDSLAPWNYGGILQMEQAGSGLVNTSLADKTVIDTASVTVAGWPEYSLGDILGQNSNITSVVMRFGTDGITTTYGLQTFANPFQQIATVFNKKIIKNRTLTNKLEKEIVNLQQIIDNLEDEIGYYSIIREDLNGDGEPDTKDERRRRYL